MPKIMVITPPKFGLTREEIETFMLRHYDFVHEVEKRLNEFCVRANWYKDYDFLEKDTLENKKEYFATCIDMLLDRETDYALFADGWENSYECNILHSIADNFNVHIIDMA